MLTKVRSATPASQFSRGTTAIATITDAEAKRRMGRGGKLNLEIDYVRLVNGDKLAQHRDDHQRTEEAVLVKGAPPDVYSTPEIQKGRSQEWRISCFRSATRPTRGLP